MTRAIRASTAAFDTRRSQARTAITISTLVLVLTTGLAADAVRAATYKWVDEKGVVHYSDKIPPEAVDKGSVELNPQGVPIRKTDKALTPEQRRAMEQEAEKQRQLDRQREEVARRDRALAASYTSEAEIDLARNRSLQTINNAVQSSQAYTEQLNKRRADVESKRAEAQGKPGIAVLDRELESIDAELARQADLIQQKKRETAALTAKYDADKQRWREIVADKAGSDATKPVASEKSANSTPSTGATAPVPPTKK